MLRVGGQLITGENAHAQSFHGPHIHIYSFSWAMVHGSNSGKNISFFRSLNLALDILLVLQLILLDWFQIPALPFHCFGEMCGKGGTKCYFRTSQVVR